MKQLLLSLVFFFLLVPTDLTLAADLTVRPFLIDHTVEARQFVDEEVKLTNNTSRRLNVYATVNEISVDTDGEIKEFVSPVMTDRTNTVTSWVEVTRGRIEVEPGETELVDLGFRINPNAQPGEYHVFIGFGVASKRHQAEAAARAGELDGVVVKLTIEDESKEYLRIAGFSIDRFVVTDNNKQVQIELENLGDTNATPEGEIIFFDASGAEIDAIPFNEDAVVVPPGERVTVTSQIPLGNELGRFKANVALQYGAKQKAALFDSTQFFMMPFHIIMLMLIIAILLALMIFFLLHRAMGHRYDDGEEGFDVPFTVKGESTAEPHEHDIDLSGKK